MRPKWHYLQGCCYGFLLLLLQLYLLVTPHPTREGVSTPVARSSNVLQENEQKLGGRHNHSSKKEALLHPKRSKSWSHNLDPFPLDDVLKLGIPLVSSTDEGNASRNARSVWNTTVKLSFRHHKVNFQLFNLKSSTLLRLLPNGTVGLSVSDSDPYTFLKLEPTQMIQPYTIRLQSVAVGIFLCMDRKGHLYSSCNRSVQCEFLPKMEKTYYTTIESKAYPRRYLAVGSNKRLRRARRLKKGRHLLEYHFFLARKKSLKQTDQLLRRAFPPEKGSFQHCADYLPSFNRKWGRFDFGLPNGSTGVPTQVVEKTSEEAHNKTVKKSEKKLRKCKGKRCNKKRKGKRKCKSKNCRKKQKKSRKNKQRLASISKNNSTSSSKHFTKLYSNYSSKINTLYQNINILNNSDSSKSHIYTTNNRVNNAISEYGSNKSAVHNISSGRSHSKMAGNASTVPVLRRSHSHKNYHASSSTKQPSSRNYYYNENSLDSKENLLINNFRPTSTSVVTLPSYPKKWMKYKRVSQTFPRSITDPPSIGTDQRSTAPSGGQNSHQPFRKPPSSSAAFHHKVRHLRGKPRSRGRKTHYTYI